MTDTAVTPPDDSPQPSAPPAPDGFFLDGDAPRLGAAPAAVPPRPEPADDATVEAGAPAMPAPAMPAPAGESSAMPAPGLPASDAPALATPEIPAPPAADVPELPSLPATTPAAPAKIEDHPVSETEPLDEQADHPMAHMMPPKSKPSEAQRRAAEMRAAKKAKSKKIKIGVAVVALAAAALAGPPLVSWLSDAVNEAGNISTEE